MDLVLDDDKPFINITIYPIKYDKENPLACEYDPREILKCFIKAYAPNKQNVFCYMFSDCEDEDGNVNDEGLKPDEYGFVFIKSNCQLVRNQDE